MKDLYLHAPELNGEEHAPATRILDELLRRGIEAGVARTTLSPWYGRRKGPSSRAHGLVRCWS
jgi:hypothetical protein